jgi:hypothetical protein
MKTLRDLALEFHKDLFTEIKGGSGKKQMVLGVPPCSMVIFENTPSSHEMFNTGEPVRSWILTKEGVEERPVDIPLPDKGRNGAYFECGHGDFAILEDRKILRLGWQVGPRFGRGYDIPYEFDSEGSPVLLEPKATWIS